MFNWFLGALAADYLQKTASQCPHEQLYRDGINVRCRSCRRNWEFDGPLNKFPSNWEYQVRKQIARERGYTYKCQHTRMRLVDRIATCDECGRWFEWSRHDPIPRNWEERARLEIDDYISRGY